MNKLFEALNNEYKPTEHERIGTVVGLLRNRTINRLRDDLAILAELMLDYDEVFIEFFEILLYSGLDDLKSAERKELIRFCAQICNYRDIRITGNDYNMDNLVYFVQEFLLDDVDFVFDIASNDLYELRLSDSYHNGDVTPMLVESAKYNAQVIVDRNK
jgi:hypothetical protein